MIERREKMIMRFLMAVLLLATATAQDAPTIDSIGSEQPVVFPEAMEKATSLISAAICPSCGADEAAWRAAALAWLNNSTWGNATA